MELFNIYFIIQGETTFFNKRQLNNKDLPQWGFTLSSRSYLHSQQNIRKVTPCANQYMNLNSYMSIVDLWNFRPSWGGVCQPFGNNTTMERTRAPRSTDRGWAKGKLAVDLIIICN